MPTVCSIKVSTCRLRSVPVDWCQPNSCWQPERLRTISQVINENNDGDSEGGGVLLTARATHNVGYVWMYESSSAEMYRSINRSRTACLRLRRCSRKSIQKIFQLSFTHNSPPFKHDTLTCPHFHKKRNTHTHTPTSVCASRRHHTGLEALLSPHNHKATQERRVAPNYTVQLSGHERRDSTPNPDSTLIVCVCVFY